HGIRFPEHLRIMEDQPFVAAALLAARTISVVASYPCYYLVRRDDGSNLSAEGLPLADVLRQTQDVVDLVRDRTAPGEVRDHLLARHVALEIVDKFRPITTWPADQRRNRVALAAPYARDWFDPAMDPLLDLADRLIVRAVARNDAEAVEQLVRWRTHGGRAPMVQHDGEWFLAGPGFDDPDGPPRSAFAMGRPHSPRALIERASFVDGHLELLGRAWLPGESSATVEPSAALVHLETGEEHPLTTSRTPTPYLNAVQGAPSLDFSTAGIRLEGDFTGTTLRPGHWGVLVRLRSTQRSEEIRPVPTEEMAATAFTGWTDQAGASVRGRVGVGTRGFVVVVLERSVEESIPEQRAPERPPRVTRWRRWPAGSDR
ncbi:MAG: hypothetical protein JOZ82_06705, partial [Marmoricola sp.]|nr:hypothetical protein [Marmoricola sp.]